MSGPTTKLPWKFVPWHIEEDSSAVRSPDGWIVCTTASDADAAFIARACNNFDELVSALDEVTQALSQHESGPRIDNARAVLAKASGGQP